MSQEFLTHSLAAVITRSDWFHFQAYSASGWHDSAPLIFLNETSIPHKLLIGGFLNSLIRELFYRSVCNMTACFIRVCKQESKRVPPNRARQQVDAAVLCNLFLEVTSCHICHILFIRSGSLGPAHNNKSMNTRKRTIRSYIKICIGILHIFHLHLYFMRISSVTNVKVTNVLSLIKKKKVPEMTLSPNVIFSSIAKNTSY